MKTLYIECNMGAAGDMLTAALLELLPDADAFVERMNKIGIPELVMRREEKISCGVRGTHMSVVIGGEEEISDDVPEHEHHHDHRHEHEHEHHHHDYDHHHEHHHHHTHSHAGLADVREIVSGLDLPEKVKQDVLGVYALIAEAEAFAHGCEIEQIHFHEVGMMDAVTDVSAVCLLMHMLAPERVVVSPVCTGFGEVRCMHGIVPVPAPATAYLLKGMPAYSGRIRGELLTPTGAALLKYFADDFGHMPLMRVEKIGHGMGMKEFESANCVRVMLGEAETDSSDEVTEIHANLDDMTGEAVAFACTALLDAGALDVYTTPIQMKKGRPAVMLSCICRPEQAQDMAALMLRHTTTLGVRMHNLNRRVLRRENGKAQTPYGEVDVKIAHGEGFKRVKAEFEDAARIAKEQNVSVLEVMRAAEK